MTKTKLDNGKNHLEKHTFFLSPPKVWRLAPEGRRRRTLKQNTVHKKAVEMIQHRAINILKQ